MPYSAAQRKELKESFDKFDRNGDGQIDWQELLSAWNFVEEKKITGAQARDIITGADKDKDGFINFEEFLEVLGNKSLSDSTGFSAVVKKTDQINKVQAYSSTGGDTTHTYSEEERSAFTDWINEALADDEDLKGKLPISTSSPNALFDACKDGVLLCKLINYAVPETVDERVLNKKNLSPFRVMENQMLCINSAKAIGCNVVNIGSHDLVEARPYLLMGLIWQIIKMGLFAQINLANHPELYRLLEEGENIEDLMKLSTEQILLRWFNYHLKKSGNPKRVHNFSKDIADSEAYTLLLNQIAPRNLGIDTRGLNEKDLDKRAKIVLDNADKLKCKQFLKPKDIVSGNAKLNLAFVARLFDLHSGLDAVPQGEIEIIEETREEKSLRNWMNSLGVDPHVNYMYEDLRDGIVLLQLFDKIWPGIVEWKKVNYPPWKQPGGDMKKIENDNYAVNLAKQVNFSVVGIGGKDIFDKNKNLTLSIVWQLMRAFTLQTLQALSGTDKPIQDKEIVEWANKKLKAAKGYELKDGWKDSKLKTAVPVLDLIEIIRSGSVDFGLVNQSGDDESNLQNAKLAISSARKIGATVFALPEDIVELKTKMILTIFASLMAVDLGVKH